jgi:hypothetical protein
MSPKALAATLLAAFALTTHVEAFQMTKKVIRNQGIFGIKVANTDLAFYGRADSILSISFQEYDIPGLIVSEVVIDMKDSNQQFRIYNARPLSTTEIANRTNRASAANAQNRGLDPNSATKFPIPAQVSLVDSKINNVVNSSTTGIVVKTYPSTTHAKTVEMTVSTKAELQMLFNKLTCLYNGIEVEAVDGASIEGSNGAAASAAATAAAGGTAAKIKITQIGGVLFTLE